MHKSVKIAFFWIILIFIGLFVATYVTIQYANRDPIHVISTDYYEKGIEYGNVIQGQKDLLAEGYVISGNIFQENHEFNAGNKQILLQLHKNGQTVHSAGMTLKIERGATNKFNKIIKLKESRTGEFHGELNIPEEGPWFITVTCMIGKKPFVKTRRIYAEK